MRGLVGFDPFVPSQMTKLEMLMFPYAPYTQALVGCPSLLLRSDTGVKRKGLDGTHHEVCAAGGPEGRRHVGAPFGEEGTQEQECLRWLRSNMHIH